MGLAASQARFLGLTARKNNNEYQAQQINQQKLNLSDQQLEITTRYQEKMNNRIMFFMYDADSSNTLDNMKQLTYWNIVTPRGEMTDSNGHVTSLGWRIVDTNGDIVVPNYPGNAGIVVDKYNIDKDLLDNDKFQKNFEKNLASGEWTMKAKRVDDEGEEYWIDLPLDGATFITKMRAENPKDETDTEYWRYFNEEVDKIDGKPQELTWKNLTSMKNYEIRLYDKDGKILSPEIPEDDNPIAPGLYKVDPHCVDNKYLEEKLRSGEWYLQSPLADDGKGNVTDWQTVPWQSCEYIYDAYDSSDDAAAEAEYEDLMAKFHHQEKMLDLRLKQLETEHKALETEMDSVSAVIKQNVESSFKTFA